VTAVSKISTMWRELEALGVPTQAKLRLQEALELRGASVLVGIDGAGHRHLCIPAPKEEEGLQDRQSRGVSIEVRGLLSPGEVQLYVDVECTLPSLNELFVVLVTEMLDVLVLDPERPFAACHGVLERWRELLEKPATPLLGREQLTGLMAELLVLEALVRHRSAAVVGWTGPEKAVHDFTCGTVDIEVKSTLRTTGRLVQVHDLSQLEPPKSGALYLAFFRLRSSPGRGRAVPEQVDTIADLCADRALLFRRLSAAGYHQDSRASYEKVTFEVAEELWYLVDDEFPRLHQGVSFMPGQPHPSITKISYLLDLDGVPARPLRERPTKVIETAAEALSS